MSKTQIISTTQIDTTNPTAIKSQLANFIQKYAAATIEYSYEICTDGTVYTLCGNEIAVDPSIIGIEKLVGAIGIHNHPPKDDGTANDSFSQNDLEFCCAYKQGKQYMVSVDRRNAFEFTKFYTEYEIAAVWKEARMLLWNKSKNERRTNWKNYNEQEEILKILNHNLKGFAFYENF